MNGCIICFCERTPIARTMEVSRFDYPAEVEATYYSCEGCGLVSKEPRPTNEELQRLYTTNWQVSLSRPKQCWTSAARWIHESAHRLSWKLEGKALDVGSKGRLLGDELGLLGARLDWDLLDANPVSQAVSEGWIGLGKIKSHDHAFVSATHVLEHAAEPRLFIQDMLGLLTESGLAYVEVPSLEGHAGDAGACDDIVRDHLWHFTTESLLRLALSCSARIVAYKLDHIPAWPVHRLLLSRSAVSGAGLMHRSSEKIREEYEYAAHLIGGEKLPDAGLYAASHSYAYLVRECPNSVLRFPIFDAYRSGKTFGEKFIYHPDFMERFGVKRVYVTTRFWNAYQDIKRWLNEKFPWLEVRSPFRGMDL